MPLIAVGPKVKKIHQIYKITKEPPIPKIVLRNEARFTLPTSFKMKNRFWKIRLATDSEHEWRKLCNQEMPDESKLILEDIWNYWDGIRIFDSNNAFYPPTKDTKKHTGWPRYIPYMSGFKTAPGETKPQRVEIASILRWTVDGEEEEEEEEEIRVIKRRKMCLCSKTH